MPAVPPGAQSSSGLHPALVLGYVGYVVTWAGGGGEQTETLDCPEMWAAVVVVLVVGAVEGRGRREVAGQAKECDDGALQIMQTDFNQCAVELTYKFEEERSPENEKVGGSELWQSCYLQAFYTAP